MSDPSGHVMWNVNYREVGLGSAPSIILLNFSATAADGTHVESFAFMMGVSIGPFPATYTTSSLIFDDKTHQEEFDDKFYPARTTAYPGSFDGWTGWASIGAGIGIAVGTIGGWSIGYGFSAIAILSFDDGHSRYGRSEISKDGLSQNGFGLGVDLATGPMFVESWTTGLPSPWWSN